MPIYEYRCGDCHRRVSLFFHSISLAEAQQAEARCPRCGGAHLQRLISHFSVIRSGDRPAAAEPDEGPASGDMDAGGGGEYGGDDDMLGGLDQEDPRSIARWARQMQAESGEDLGPEFNRALGRIEAGEDPDRVMEDVEPELGADGNAGDDGDLGDDY